MSLNHLIIANIKKNLKHYYLYVFALIFSAALYFAFVTLQFDPSMDKTEGSIKGAAGMQSASILLIAIVAIFLLYANTIFIKRRGKEIGLFQLIGMTKGKIFQILSTENLILYFGSLVIGIFLGFSFSKLMIMILFKITGVKGIASLRFSLNALIQTLVVFAVIYLFIMIMNAIFIKRQSILSLFRVTSSAEEKVRKISAFQIGMGILGIVLILFGYYVSTKLFDGAFSTAQALLMAMITILGSVIIGTYLFYKGSVSFIFHLIRKKKDGYLTLNDVLSISPIMFRMKSNSLLLTIITTVSALAIGLLSLSYISYYSAEKLAAQLIPNNFSMTSPKGAANFTNALDKHRIKYSTTRINVIMVDADLSHVLDAKEARYHTKKMTIPVISEEAVKKFDVAPGQVLFIGFSQALQQFMTLKDNGPIFLKGNTQVIKQQYIGLKKEDVLSGYFNSNGLPTAIVNQTTYHKLAKDQNPKIQKDSSVYIGIDIKNQANLEQANQIFQTMGFNQNIAERSQLDFSNMQKKAMGLSMFIVGFLGLTFLITSGCILYFKQMDESEEEKPGYTILRKLGFTQGDLLNGIQRKQIFNFGIPLVVGLCHSYFAVKSGWFFFGTEMWTPMIIVMVFYTALYSIFGILSVLYYKKVIQEAL